jgi:hypothetical protein
MMGPALMLDIQIEKFIAWHLIFGAITTIDLMKLALFIDLILLYLIAFILV